MNDNLSYHLDTGKEDCCANYLPKLNSMLCYCHKVISIFCFRTKFNLGSNSYLGYTCNLDLMGINRFSSMQNQKCKDNFGQLGKYCSCNNLLRGHMCNKSSFSRYLLDSIQELSHISSQNLFYKYHQGSKLYQKDIYNLDFWGKYHLHSILLQDRRSLDFQGSKCQDSSLYFYHNHKGSWKPIHRLDSILYLICKVRKEHYPSMFGTDNMFWLDHIHSFSYPAIHLYNNSRLLNSSYIICYLPTNHQDSNLIKNRMGSYGQFSNYYLDNIHHLSCKKGISCLFSTFHPHNNISYSYKSIVWDQ